MKVRNLIIGILVYLLSVSVALNIIIPIFNSKVQNTSQQAAAQAVNSVLIAIQQKVVNTGEVAIETQQGRTVLVVKPEKKDKKR